MKRSSNIYLFTRSQIVSGDVSDFVARYDPRTFNVAELARMCGTLRIRVEGTRTAHDLFADLHCRLFFRRLHKQFPYWAYFLRLHPLRSSKPSPALTDAVLFMGIGLCQTDVVSICWDQRGEEATIFEVRQFHEFMKESSRQTNRLGKRAGLTGPAIAHRRQVVIKTVRSFLRLGNLQIISGNRRTE